MSTPLSVDRRVWPIIFEDGNSSVPADLPPYWNDFDDMRELCGEQQDGAAGFQPVFIIVRKQIDAHVDGSPAAPCPIEDEQSSYQINAFLGYDIADRFLLSALTNFGFVSGVDDVVELRSKWGRELNQSHLFDSLDQANEFKNYSAHRFPEHKPFSVYSIHSIATCL